MNYLKINEYTFSMFNAITAAFGVEEGEYVCINPNCYKSTTGNFIFYELREVLKADDSLVWVNWSDFYNNSGRYRENPLIYQKSDLLVYL